MLPLFASVRRLLAICVNKGLRYWILAGVFSFLGWYGSHLLDDSSSWLEVKYRAYVLLQDSRGGQRRVPQTTLVAIDDEEYYGRVLAGRRPLKRDYLATLISRIAEARPLLIALDIDFRSPVPNSMSSHFDDYREEDRAMDAALCANRAKTMI